jgi:hypothetical protein
MRRIAGGDTYFAEARAACNWNACSAPTSADRTRSPPPTSHPTSPSECKAGSESMSLPPNKVRTVPWTDCFAGSRSTTSIRACVLHRVFRFRQLLPIPSSGRSVCHWVDDGDKQIRTIPTRHFDVISDVDRNAISIHVITRLMALTLHARRPAAQNPVGPAACNVFTNDDDETDPLLISSDSISNLHHGAGEEEGEEGQV